MPKKKGNRLIRRYIFLLVVIAILGLGGIKLFSLLEPLFGSRENDFDRMTTIKIENEKEENKAKVLSANGYLIIYDKDKLTLYNSTGQKLWEKELTSEEIMIQGSDSIIALADASEGLINFYDYKGNEINKVNLEGKIYTIKSFDNYIGVALEERNEIFLYNENGEETTKIEIPQGKIIDFELSKNKEIIGVAILNVEEFYYHSNVFLYSLEGRVLAGNKIEEGIIYYLQSSGEDNILAIGDNTMLLLSKDQGVVWKKSVEGINKIERMNSDKIIINYIKSNNPILDTKNRNTIVQINTDGENIHQTPILGDILGIDANNEHILAFSKRTIFLLDDEGRILLERKINSDINDVFWISKGTFAIVLKGKVEIMTLNY